VLWILYCLLPQHQYRYTLLHAAARHNRADCIPLLIAKGVDVLALNAQSASALQLACLYSDTDIVQLLLDSGARLDHLASACMLNATIAGSVDTMAVLCDRGVSYSTALDDAEFSTLLHVAAAYGRLECVSLLLQHGCGAKTLSSDGVSVLDMVLTTELPAALKRTSIKRPAWYDRSATAELLLRHGVTCTASNVIGSEQCAVLLEYIGELREQNAQQHEVLSTHAKDLCSASEETGMQPSSTDAVCTAVKVQLVDSTTGAKSKRVYKLDTALLSKLHAVTAPGSAGGLLSMLAPLDGLLSVDGHDTADDIKLLSYNGKLAFILYHFARY
jgi:Ankyrin repeats (3 copies)/Ankyrin repeat